MEIVPAGTGGPDIYPPRSVVPLMAYLATENRATVNDVSHQEIRNPGFLRSFLAKTLRLCYIYLKTYALRRRGVTLSFMRNKVVQAESLADGNLLVSWRLVDTLVESEIRTTFQIPDLEIIRAEAQVLRSLHPECREAFKQISKIIGVRVGPGVRKIVNGLLGGKDGCQELAEGILESCNAVILHFTVPQIQENEKGTEEERKEKLQAMLRFNPRLVRSCVAFADDSPLMEGLDL